MLRVVSSTGSVLRHPLLADRSKIRSTTGGSLEQKQRHREAKQTGANRNPHRDRHAVHGAIMPHLNKLRNRFVRRLSWALYHRARAKIFRLQNYP
jgi:hypothetical protein